MGLSIEQASASYMAQTMFGVANTLQKQYKPKSSSNNAAIYEKSSNYKYGTYNIRNMSEDERAEMVEKLKQDQEVREQNFLNIVQQSLGGQLKSISMSSEEMWHALANGEFTVDIEAQKKAQEDISEDGYFGIKQTSQRLFDFAITLAGDDVNKMKKMQESMQKGFDQATKTWGKELPELSKQTIEATNKLFDNYYSSKEEKIEVA